MAFLFLGVTFALQMAGSITEASVATSHASVEAQGLCESLSQSEAAVKAISDNIIALTSHGEITEEQVKQQLAEIKEQTFISEGLVAQRKRKFALKLSLTLIVGICTTLTAIFVIMRHSDDLQERLAAIAK